MRNLAVLTLLAALPASGSAADPPSTVALEPALRERCVKILRDGVASDEFWPAMHAAEGLTYAGHGRDVLDTLAKRSETDDQKRCGLAREAVRAGDRAKLPVLFEILDKPGSNGHTHAAESLYKLGEVGDGKKMRAAFAQDADPKLKLMAAAALARAGDAAALDAIRKHLTHADVEVRKAAVWLLGKIGSKTDIDAVRAGQKKETDVLPRAYFAHALALLGDPAGRKTLGDNMASADLGARTFAAEFAGYCRATEFRDGLVKLLDDPILDVRVRAAQSLIVLAASPTVLPLPGATATARLFDRSNLVAWCIVPFDAKKRTPEDRAAMLKRLGFRRYAYDWRAEHLPTFEREVAALTENGIELTAVWFPANLGPDAQALLAVIKKHGLHPQLWITTGEPAGATQEAKVEAAAKTLRPIAEAADALGCTVGLYNHGGWFGEPENQLAIIEHLKRTNVGIVYNQHHGHDHIDRFAELLRKARPHLLAVNLNGMAAGGDKAGKKILPLGQGDQDLKLLKTLADSGYRGPVGILGHTQDDAEERLRDNLDGLDWLLPQLGGQPAGPKPKPRTMASALAAQPAGWLADGKPEYRAPTLTVECRAKLAGKGGFNILVASDTKASAAHWELFTWPKTGRLTAYLPGLTPDHVRSETDVCDGQWHTVAMQLEPTRVRLYVDGKQVAEQAVTRSKTKDVPGPLAFGRLVEGGIGCDGRLDRVRLSQGTVTPSDKELAVNEATVGLWVFGDRDKSADDLSKTKNPAKPAATGTPTSFIPPPGPNLVPTNPKLKATLIDRSPDEAYMAVKVDGAGRLFVGGREKVFVFEPDGKGGFGPRRELLRFPPDSIIIGLEYRGDDLYVLAAHGLYLVPGGRTRRENLTPKRILWGLPLDFHVSFHCLAWGPEGDLYLTHGDPLLNYGDWTRPDHWGHWTLFAGPAGEKVPYTGAGAVLKVRPDGSNPRVVARGLRGPVGLTFDKDWNLFTNDNDHESRADQYAPMRLLHVTPHADFGWPRGWMASKSPDRADLLDSIHPALGRGVPCDLAYYDEPAIPDLRGQLLMCRWDRFAVTRYTLKRNGATFAAEEAVFAQGSNLCRPTGIAVDGAGRVFVTSLYLGGNVVTPKCPSDLVVIAAGDTRVSPSHETRAAVGELQVALGADSWDTRRRAHLELLRRDHTKPAAGSEPVGRLDNLDPAVRLAGLVRLFEDKSPLPFDAVAKVATESDPVLRQTAATLLARRAERADLARLFTSEDARTRHAGVLAAGIRLTVPAPDAPPPPGVSLHFPKGSSFFSPELRFADKPTPVNLTALGPIGSYTTAQWWEARTRTPGEDELFKLLLAALDDRDDLVRSQAAYYLGWLRDPRSEPAVNRVRLELRTRGLTDRPPVAVKEAWRIGRFADAAAAVERGPIDLAAAVPAGGDQRTWEAPKGGDKGLSLPAGAGAVYAYFRVQSRDRQPALLTAGSDIRLWHNGRAVTPEFDGSVLLDLQPGGNDVLLRTSAAGPLAVNIRARGSVSVELPEKADGTALAERLKAAKGAAVPAEFLAIDWSAEGRTGNAASGRKLFGSLGCAKCHAVTADQAGGGAPSLAEAGKRFTPAHLAESVLLPDRLVADEFRATRIVTADGKSLVGLVVRETADEIELLLPDTTRQTLKTADIEERKPVAASPMPGGLVKTPAELRDLLAYLLSDRPLPP